MDKKLKIMLIDDSERSRKAIEDILESKNYDVVGSYSNGSDALKNFQISGANLFIIDIVMPDLSGLEVAKTISDKSREIYIIMMSSLDSENVVMDAISHGAIDFLHKPFETEDLLKSVAKIENELNRE